MHLTAHYSDGFTSRLLTWKLSAIEGLAEVEAYWSAPMPRTTGFRAEFAISFDPLARLLPSLRQLDEKYSAPWDDLDNRLLTIESPNETLRRQVYGIGVLIKDQPELGAFLNVWTWLEGEVLAQLPRELQPQPARKNQRP